jgi:7-carboxy-7-deazaguanine synthase
LRMENARVHEIFASIQGEGPWIGQRHIFIRFLGCYIKCRYCDTPASVRIEPENKDQKYCVVQKSIHLQDHELVPNPLSTTQLSELCSRLIIPGQSMPTLALTGGEPLLHRTFLAEWLPTLHREFRIYLETSGIHPGAMEVIRDLVDIVSMDFKLPSATGIRSFWDEHREFLSILRGKTVYVKTVVTADTTLEDVLRSVEIIASFDPATILVIQPASAPFTPSSTMLVDFQNRALGILEDVRVIPQAHIILQVP